MKEKIIAKNKDHLKKLIEQEIKSQGWNADLNHIDVSNVEDMSWLFNDSKFDGDISKWNVSNVVSMCCMFSNSRFNGDISKWNVSNVDDMCYMFGGSPLNGNEPKWYKKSSNNKLNDS